MHAATVTLMVAFSPLLIQTVSGLIVGGPIQAQLTEERKNQLVNYSLEAFHRQTNSAFKYQVINVDSITSQVVNGVLYKVNVELAETDCRTGTVGKQCALKTDEGSKNLKCEINIHEKPWENYRNVVLKSCRPK